MGCAADIRNVAPDPQPNVNTSLGKQLRRAVRLRPSGWKSSERTKQLTGPGLWQE